MKNLILILGLMLVSLIGYSQATAVGEFRVATQATAFGVKLPIGTKLYCIADSTYWVLKAPALETATIATIADPDIFQLNKTAVDTDDQNLSYDAGNHQIDIDGGGTSATIPLADDDGTTEGLASFTAVDFTVDAAGNVAIDYTNGQEASTNTTGFLNDADWDTFNNKLSAEVDGSVTNEGALTVGAGGANDSKIVSNTVGDKAVVIAGGTGITITEADSTITIAYGGTVVRTVLVEWFEVASDDLTTPYPITLAQTPSATTIISVQLNGQPVKYAAGTTAGTFNFSGTALSLYLPVYQYDVVEVRYQY